MKTTKINWNKYAPMNRAALLFLILLVSLIPLSAQDVTLVTTGEGYTKDDATKAALRSALEQTFQTFVSANTTILNDDIVKDEVATVTSGNIKSYKELSCTKDKQGVYKVTVSATVSVGKLIEFARSHGSSAEFAGQAFAMNIKMLELNKKNEKEALNNLLLQLKSFQDNLYDYTINVKDPQQKNGSWYVPIEVTTISNKNYENFFDILTKTLSSLSLTKEDKIIYNTNSIPVNEIKILQGSVNTRVGTYKNENVPRYYRFFLRSDEDILEKFTKRVCEILNSSQISGSIKEIEGEIKATTPLVHKFISREKEITGPELNMGTEIVTDIDKIGQKWKAERTQWVNVPMSDRFSFPPVIVNLSYNLADLGKVQGFEIKPKISRSSSDEITANSDSPSNSDSPPSSQSFNKLIKFLQENKRRFQTYENTIEINLKKGKRAIFDFNSNTIITPSCSVKFKSVDDYDVFIIFKVDFGQEITVMLGAISVEVNGAKETFYYEK